MGVESLMNEQFLELVTIAIGINKLKAFEAGSSTVKVTVT